MTDSQKLIPPKELFYCGKPENYGKVGQEFLRYFVRLCNLAPEARVLDVGCGIGRVAVALAAYLTEKGCYEGFDIVPEAVAWCSEHISSRYPNFHFREVDINNTKYNPKGRQQALEYTFPYDTESFDFVFLTSVFTHMLPQDMEHYLREVARVLKKDCACLITFFLLNQESLTLLDAGHAAVSFPHDFGPYRTKRLDKPEAVVAYRERFILDLYAEVGLQIQKPIHYGNWCGRSTFLSFQDIIVASKR